jgi:hypothetical protein
MKRQPRYVICCAAALLLTPFAPADQVIIEPAKDNTLYEDSNGALSNGAGEYFFAGKTGANAGFRLHRGLIAFDIAANVPAGATIDSVTLTLHLATGAPGSGDQPAALHRGLADWGEGASNAGSPGGFGAPASPDDATWLHTFFDSSFWASAGGDFDPSASATTLIGTRRIFYTWESPEMAADVQSWLDSPSGNFGWTLLGNEAEDLTARRYESRENSDASLRPTLTIDFTPGSSCNPCDMNCDGTVDANDIEFFIDLLFNGATPCDPCTGDVNGDGFIDAGDIEGFINCLFP